MSENNNSGNVGLIAFVVCCAAVGLVMIAGANLWTMLSIAALGAMASGMSFLIMRR